MGKICSKKEKPKEDRPSVTKFEDLDFFCPPHYGSNYSITIPSKCDAPSYVESVKASQKSSSSETFRWSQMMSVIMEQETYSAEKLSSVSIKMASQAMDTLKKNLREICSDHRYGVVTVPDPIIEKFKPLIDTKATVNQITPTNSPSLNRKLIFHFIAVIYIHDHLITDLRNGDKDAVRDFLNQVAVSHALKGITPAEFRLLDWFLIHYLVKHQLMNEEIMNSFIHYLSVITNHITKFYEDQSTHAEMLDKMTTEKENDRFNRPRENYRLMKQWQENVAPLKEQEQYIEELLEQLVNDTDSSQEESIDTLTLKRNDCIMKHFIKKKKVEIRKPSSEEEQSLTPTPTQSSSIPATSETKKEK